MTRALALLFLLSIGCGSDPSSLRVTIEHVSDSCGGLPAGEVLIEGQHTVTVHVVDATNNTIVAMECFQLPPLERRSLRELPSLLNENAPIPGLSEDSMIVVELAVWDGALPDCPRYEQQGERPRLFGRSTEVLLSGEVPPIKVIVRCLR